MLFELERLQGAVLLLVIFQFAGHHRIRHVLAKNLLIDVESRDPYIIHERHINIRLGSIPLLVETDCIIDPFPAQGIGIFINRLVQALHFSSFLHVAAGAQEQNQAVYEQFPNHGSPRWSKNNKV